MYRRSSPSTGKITVCDVADRRAVENAVNQDPLARQAAPQPAPVIVIAHLADQTGANAEVSQDHRGVDRAAAGVKQEAVAHHKLPGPGQAR